MKLTASSATAAWIGCTALAVVLALRAPSEREVMGQLPQAAAAAVDQSRKVLVPPVQGERMLAVVWVSREQKPEAKSWITGLKLAQERSLPWVKLRVLQDPGTESGRQLVQARMNAHPNDPGRLVAVFADAGAVARSLSLPSAEHAHVVVLDGEGNVLARAEGGFDEEKAAALRDTLLAP
jgi:hypothetical protein